MMKLFVINSILIFVNIIICDLYSPIAVARLTDVSAEQGRRYSSWILALLTAGYTLIALLFAFTFHSKTLSLIFSAYLFMDCLHSVWAIKAGSRC